MSALSRGLVILVALLHVGFLVLEMFLWTKPFGLKTFGQSLEKAQSSAALAANQQLGTMQSQIKEQQKTIKLSKQELAKLNTQLKADEQAISAAAAKLNQTRQQLKQNQRYKAESPPYLLLEQCLLQKELS